MHQFTGRRRTLKTDSRSRITLGVNLAEPGSLWSMRAETPDHLTLIRTKYDSTEQPTQDDEDGRPKPSHSGSTHQAGDHLSRDQEPADRSHHIAPGRGRLIAMHLVFGNKKWVKSPLAPSTFLETNTLTYVC